MTNNSLDARIISEQILAIEQSLNLNATDWVIENTHLWPIYRLELYRLMFIARTKQPTKKSTRPDIAAAFKRCKVSSATAGAPNDIWLVSDGISFSSVGDADFERFCNPIFNTLLELGHDSVLIDRGSSPARRTIIPARWWTPITQRAKLLGILRAAIVPDSRHLWIIQQISSIAAKAGFELPQLSAKRLNAMTNAILSLASKLEKKMRDEHVKAVFVVGYYDVGGYAYVLAANRANISCVDVQHGVTGELHLAYANWNIGSSVELTLLPKGFLCWTQEDARIVRRWADINQKTNRQTFVSGHPFLEAWKNGGIHLPDEAQVTLAKLIKHAEDRPVVLVTLQPNLCNKESLEPLLQTWLQKPNVDWWIRMHPLAQGEHTYIESILKQYKVHHWNIKDATFLPLPALLERSSIHATHSSSTVIEAELLGIPSLIWSEYGGQLFEAQILRGTSARINGSEDFINELSNLTSQQKILPTDNASNQLSKALKEILETKK